MAKIRAENDTWIKQWKRTKTYKALSDKTKNICKDPLFQKERYELLRLFDPRLSRSLGLIFCKRWNIDFNAFIENPYRSAYENLGSNELPLKGITVTLPIEFSKSNSGYREKSVTIKITQPINNEVWKDIWLQVGWLQKDVFGKTPKGRPKSRPYRIKNDKKIRNTLQDRINRGKEIFGSHVDSSWQANLPDVSIEKISEKLSAMSKRGKKFLCYSFSKMKPRKSNRDLARIFGVDKGTVGNWINEVNTWSEDERKAVESEVRTSKNLPNKDAAYATKESQETESKKYIKVHRPKTLLSLDKIEHAITDEEVYDTGRKKKHKSSDK